MTELYVNPAWRWWHGDNHEFQFREGFPYPIPSKNSTLFGAWRRMCW